MPIKRHSLPRADDVDPNEPLPEFLAVMAQHGPQGDNGPTWVLPDFSTQEYEPWLPALEVEVEQEAAEKAPQIAEEAAQAVRDAPHQPWTLGADKPLSGDYTLSWNKPPTSEPIKVMSERADRPPSPRPRRVKP